MMASGSFYINTKKALFCLGVIIVITYFGFLKTNNRKHASLIDDRKDPDIQLLRDLSWIDGKTSMEDPSTHWNEDLSTIDKLVYNRVPKCGSATTSKLFNKLAEDNEYKVIFVLKNGPKYLNYSEQVEVVKRTKREKPPWVYIQHFHLINFTEFELDMPVHINLVRDPIERKMSGYYYIRFKSPRKMTFERRNMTFDECIKIRDPECTSPKKIFAIAPYFCGSHPRCHEPSVWALNRAKQNVIRYFSVVGYLEEVEKFYFVLEKTMPQFFRGLLKVFEENAERLTYATSNKHPKVLSESSRLYLRSLLGYEYDFYYFVQNRFTEIYERIRDGGIL